MQIGIKKIAALYAASAGAGDHQRLSVFGGVNNVIAGDGVDGQHRHGEIHRQPVVSGRRVTRFIAYRGTNGVLAGGQIAEIRRR